jgi:asparagine synthase (glutamine-hydrolysing)
MRRHAGGEIHTFNVGFAEDGYGEFPYARQVARRFETRHHEYVLSPEDFVGFLPRLIREFSDPVADPAAIPLYFIARVARERGITVVLSGEGSDELFAGYPTYASYLGDGGVWSAARRIARAGRAWWRRFPYRAAGFSRLRPHAYPGHATLPDPGLVDALLTTSAFDWSDRDPLDEYDARARAAGMDRLQTMLATDLWTRIPEDLLCRTDRMTMANSVEARVPFLDHHMVEFGFWMPSEFKLRGGIGKYALKRAAEAWLPTELIYRPKMGFPTPIRSWLSGELRGLFRHWLLDVRETPRGCSTTTCWSVWSPGASRGSRT